MFFNKLDKTKEAARLVELEAVLEGKETALAAARRQFGAAPERMKTYASLGNVAKVKEYESSAISLAARIAELEADVAPLRNERDAVRKAINAAIRESVNGSDVYKKYEKLEREFEALEERERELIEQKAAAHQAYESFRALGAEGAYGRDEFQWMKYSAKDTALAAEWKGFTDKIHAVQRQKEILMKNELGPASSALSSREREIFEELLSSVTQ